MSDSASAVLVCAIEGASLSNEEREFYRRLSPAGVTLFTRNIPQDQNDTALLVQELQSLRASGAPPFVVAIDQEGGRVARLKALFPNYGPAMSLAGGREDDDALAEIRNLAGDMGRRLKALGVNVNFAPVLDILTEPTNNAIGDRAFGTDVGPVCSRAGAFLRGMQREGVFGCLKHFPGQGDAKVDTHAGRAVVDLPIRTLNDRELVPFRALLHEAPMVMVSHCIYPHLAPEEASRSPKIMGGLLRGEMGFDGVIVSDDMNMGAIPQDIDVWKDAIVESVAAGADMILVCRHLDKCIMAHEALTKTAARSKAFGKRLVEAAGRVTAMRRRF